VKSFTLTTKAIGESMGLDNWYGTWDLEVGLWPSHYEAPSPTCNVFYSPSTI